MVRKKHVEIMWISCTQWFTMHYEDDNVETNITCVHGYKDVTNVYFDVTT